MAFPGMSPENTTMFPGSGGGRPEQPTTMFPDQYKQINLLPPSSPTGEPPTLGNSGAVQPEVAKAFEDQKKADAEAVAKKAAEDKAKADALAAPIVYNPVAAPTAITAPTYDRQGQAMQKAAESSYGGSATEALRMAMGAGQDYAAEQAGRSAMGAGTQATGYARASGLSPAQAALMAGQGAGTAYNDAYSKNLSDSVNQYRGLAGDIGGLGLSQGAQGLQQYGTDIQKYGQDLGSATSRYGTDVNANINKYSTDVGARTSLLTGKESSDTTKTLAQQQAQQQQQQQDSSFWGALLSGGAALATAALSDKNAKTDINDGYGILDAVTKQVNPKSFKYKQETGEDQSKHFGVMAQDLEKTPLAYTVKQGDDGMKRVDTGQLTLGNTAMISEMSKKLDELSKFMKVAK